MLRLDTVHPFDHPLGSVLLMSTSRWYGRLRHELVKRDSWVPFFSRICAFFEIRLMTLDRTFKFLRKSPSGGGGPCLLRLLEEGSSE